MFIFVRLDGKLIVVRTEQPSKAWSGRYVSPSGKVTVSNEVHFSKAFHPICITDSGIEIVVMLVCLKA